MKIKLRLLVLFVACFVVFGMREVSASPALCGDSFASAGVVGHGSYEGGHLDENESCYLSLDVESGYELNIDYEITGRNFFGHVTLYDKDQKEIAGGDEANLVLRWLGSGGQTAKYYIIIKNSYVTDGFNLNIGLIDRIDANTGFDAGGDFSQATEITDGEFSGYLSNFVYGNIGGDDLHDYYKLLVKKGDKVEIRVTPDSDFIVGLGVYDSNRTELINEEGLDLNRGEIVQESFDITKDGYIYIVVKWPRFGGFDNRIEEYVLLVTNESLDNLGGQININGETDINTNNLLVIGFFVVLIVLFIVLIVIIMSMLAKKKKKSLDETTSHVDLNESRENVQKVTIEANEEKE